MINRKLLDYMKSDEFLERFLSTAEFDDITKIIRYETRRFCIKNRIQSSFLIKSVNARVSNFSFSSKDKSFPYDDFIFYDYRHNNGEINKLFICYFDMKGRRHDNVRRSSFVGKVYSWNFGEFDVFRVEELIGSINLDSNMKMVIRHEDVGEEIIIVEV